MAATSFPNPFFPSGGEGMDLGEPATRRRSVEGSESAMRSNDGVDLSGSEDQATNCIDRGGG
uniref:DUF834 domain-containing protein n=1 Tax=Oryza meridionalis TaxID=40149 RepID=A0A0E0F9K2_9ORYZ